MVEQQAARVGTVATGVPPGRQCTGHAVNDLQAFGHVLAFGGFIDLLVVDPTPAVAGDFVAEFYKGLREVGVALKCHADAEHCER